MPRCMTCNHLIRDRVVKGAAFIHLFPWISPRQAEQQNNLVEIPCKRLQNCTSAMDNKMLNSQT